MTQATMTAAVTHASAARSHRPPAQAGRTTLYVIAIGAPVFFMLPFVWAVFSSFKAPGDLTSYPPKAVSEVWHPENYREVFERVPFDAGH